jgi:hypothetical protein
MNVLGLHFGGPRVFDGLAMEDLQIGYGQWRAFYARSLEM